MKTTSIYKIGSEFLLSRQNLLNNVKQQIDGLKENVEEYPSPFNS